MTEPDESATLTDEEIETRRTRALETIPADDTGDDSADDTGDDAGDDTGDDSGDIADPSDTGDDSGDDSAA